jgi:WD40 repeat protein
MRALAYSPDGRYLASGGRNGVVRVWDVKTAKVTQESQAHRRRVRGIAFSPDSGAIASCGEDGRIRLQSLLGQPDVTIESPGTKVMSLCYCGAQHLATGGSDNMIRIWDVVKQSKVSELSGHTGSVVTLAFGGSVLVSAGYDTTVRVWSTASNLVNESDGQTDRVGSRWEPRNRSPQ